MATGDARPGLDRRRRLRRLPPSVRLRRLVARPASGTSWPHSVDDASPSSTRCTTCATPTTRTAACTTRSSTCLSPRPTPLVTLTAGAARRSPAVGPTGSRRAAPARRPTSPRWTRLAPVARPAGEVRIGLHVKSLRASMDPGRLLPTLLRFVATNPGTVLQVNGHRDVLEPGGARYCAELAIALHDAAAAGLVDLRVHDFMTDAELFGPTWPRSTSPSSPTASAPTRLAGSVPRPRHDGGGPQLRLLRRPGPGPHLRQRGSHLRARVLDECPRSSGAQPRVGTAHRRCASFAAPSDRGVPRRPVRTSHPPPSLSGPSCDPGSDVGTPSGRGRVAGRAAGTESERSLARVGARSCYAEVDGAHLAGTG